MNINFDICLELISYLDIDDIINFFNLSKITRQLWISNQYYFKRLLIHRILDYFYFKKCLNEIQHEVVDEILTILLKIYKNFCYHKYSHRIDFLLYMLEHNLDCDILFEYFANFCNYKYNFETSELRTITDGYFQDEELFNVSLADMKYILNYSNMNQLQIILKIFTIPVSILTYVIDEMITNNFLCNDKLLDTKIMSIIDYIFYKFCFGSFDTINKTYIQKLIISLIQHKRTILLKHFFKTKQKYFRGNFVLDYQELINKSIQLRDQMHLKLLLAELKLDNQRLIKRGLNPIYVIINTNLIIDLCKGCHFEYLKYIADDLLGECINYELYVSSICEGLKICSNPKSIKKIQYLSQNFNDTSKQKINNCLQTLYKDNKMDVNYILY